MRDVLELDFRIPILEGQANQEETAAAGAAVQGELEDVGMYVTIKFIHDDSPIKYDEWWGDKETFIENIFGKKGMDIYDKL